MTYAEAVKRAELWEHGRLRPTGEDTEALAVLRRAGKVMEAIEKVELHRNGPNAREPGKVWIAKAEDHQPFLRACAEYRKGE